MPFDIDPYTQVYRALWNMLIESPELSRLVRIGNRIRWDEQDPDPQKHALSDADLPEIQLDPVAGEVNLTGSSTSVACEQAFQLQLTSNDSRLHLSAFPLKWALIKTLSRWRSALGLAFVKQIRLGDVIDIHAADDPDRGAAGWSMTLTISVEMWIAQADVEAE